MWRNRSITEILLRWANSRFRFCCAISERFWKGSYGVFCNFAYFW
jgi:hypothetical protein